MLGLGNCLADFCVTASSTGEDGLGELETKSYCLAECWNLLVLGIFLYQSSIADHMFRLAWDGSGLCLLFQYNY